MLACAWISVSLREAEIDQVNHPCLFVLTNANVFWFHVAVYVTLVVQKLQPVDHLNTDHEARFNGEFLVAKVKQLL